MVSLKALVTFPPYSNLVKFNVGIACSDYSITFGDLKGFIIGEDGTKYEIDDVGIGEDRSMKLL